MIRIRGCMYHRDQNGMIYYMIHNAWSLIHGMNMRYKWGHLPMPCHHTFRNLQNSPSGCMIQYNHHHNHYHSSRDTIKLPCFVPVGYDVKRLRHCVSKCYTSRHLSLATTTMVTMTPSPFHQCII